MPKSIYAIPVAGTTQQAPRRAIKILQADLVFVEQIKLDLDPKVWLQTQGCETGRPHRQCLPDSLSNLPMASASHRPFRMSISSNRLPWHFLAGWGAFQ